MGLMCRQVLDIGLPPLGFWSKQPVLSQIAFDQIVQPIEKERVISKDRQK
jgi:hypothetical protein